METIKSYRENAYTSQAEMFQLSSISENNALIGHSVITSWVNVTIVGGTIITLEWVDDALVKTMN